MKSSTMTFSVNVHKASGSSTQRFSQPSEQYNHTGGQSQFRHLRYRDNRPISQLNTAAPHKTNSLSPIAAARPSQSKAHPIFSVGAQRPFFPSVRPITFESKAAILENAPSLTTQKITLETPVVVIDNYDSFTYNLVQYLGSLGCPVEVYRNDELTVEELKMKEPSGILISPGPGAPQDSGISLKTVIKLGPEIPLFGVCMGLQCMGEAFGGKIVRSPLGVMHGKKSLVYYDEHGEDGLLAGLPNPFVAGRYHSLVIDKETFPSNELEVTAWTEDGLVMGVRHKKYRHVQGVQFHPESIITENGMKIMENFLDILVRKARKH